MSRLRVLVAGLAALLALTGCTGVPTSSAPQTIERLPLGAQPSAQAIKPGPADGPRDIVRGFLAANGADPGKHTSARAFLTTDFGTRWTDATATIITDNPSIGVYDNTTHKLTVTGKKLGALDAHGVYTPNTEGDGTGSTVSFEFTLAEVQGEYRINQLRGASGLILTETQFAQTYKQQPLYFYDNAQRYLVADPRYSDIGDRGLGSEWLLTQLATGPQDNLAEAVTSDTLPAQTDPSRITVKLSAPTLVEIPGSSQLDANGRDRLAAQLAATLDDPLGGDQISITDGGRAVTIPAVHGTAFGPADFASEVVDSTPVTPEIYYLSPNAQLYGENGRAVGGPLGRGGYSGLSSVALTRLVVGGPLLVAGVIGQGTADQLWTGSESAGLKPTTVRGNLTRPSFAHGRREVWVGNGTAVDRLTVNAAGDPIGKPVVVPVAGAAAGSRVVSVRISPDGVRIALVLSGPAGANQLWIGSIVRGTGPLQIVGLHAISPKQAVITDVAWITSLRLFAIGRLGNSSDPVTFDTGVDGTDWTPAQVTGLPRAPETVTVTAGASAWVAAGNFVWTQSGGQWAPPVGGQTPGTAPVYVE